MAALWHEAGGAPSVAKPPTPTAGMVQKYHFIVQNNHSFGAKT
ncbi:MULTISPECIES: hypothetical protein [Neisseria]|nr:MULTISPECIES: hypothetical protein [Neisseria]MDO5070601.1 hypothetical protein [Neisseria zoodegmatis]